MEIGSLVETVGDFTRVQIEWGFGYPKKGELLVVSDITKHPNKQMDKKGIVLLNFYEYPNLVGVCDKTYQGKYNFLELQKPMNVEYLLNREQSVQECDTTKD
jgi:hypothetical protein